MSGCEFKTIKIQGEEEMPTVRMVHIALELWGCLFCFVAGFTLFLSRDFEKHKRLLLMYIAFDNAILLAADVIAWFFRGYPGRAGYYMVRISNFLVFLFTDIIMILYHSYVCESLFPEVRREKNKKFPIRAYVVYIIMTIAVIMVVISQFTNLYYYFDDNNYYHRNTFYPVSLISGLICGAIVMSLIIQYRKRISQKSFIALVSYIMLPILATIMLLFYYGISFLNLAMTISVLIMYIVALIEQSEMLRKKDKQMYDMKVQVMLSQIGPHFIYNTLSTIRHLCKKDQDLAVETIDEFSVYLRGNLDSLSRPECIPFEQELYHAKNYLAIEKTRFGDKLNIAYNIEDTDFLLPVLTIQPLAENAVKHGIMKKDEGGTLTITSRRTKGGHLVLIEDDGAGFDVNAESKKDSKVHVGVGNVKNRLKIMCGGEIKVESEPGKGTRISIFIP